MMRHLRLLGLISIAMFALFAAPTVVGAQTPVQDQYQPPPDDGTGPDDDGGDDDPADDDPADDAAPANDDADDDAPVVIQRADAGGNGNLPFTGGSVPLIALIGLALLAAGLVGAAASRKRRTPGSPSP